LTAFPRALLFAPNAQS